MSATLSAFLREEFQKLSSRNPKYSIRAFSRKLGISPATLSRILSGKQTPRNQVIDKIGKKLGLSQQQLDSFYALTIRSKKLKKELPHFIEAETFLKVSDLYHYVLL